jgi:hypothetical protein
MQIRKKGGWNLKKIFSSETIEPISTKLCWNDSWLVLFQNCVRHFRTPTKMAATAELNLTWDPMGNSHKKVWLQLAQWFLRRRFLCEFPIGSYVKLNSAVGAILVERPNRWTHFWKRTIQWLFHQHFVLIEQMISRLPTMMAAKLRIEKKGSWIFF